MRIWGRTARFGISRTWTCAGALCLLSLLPPPASAQTVLGRLLEQGSRDPIASGQVALLDAGSREVDRTVTDHDGRFQLTSPDSGSFYVRAEALGYRTKVDGILELGEGGRITIDFFLARQPIELDSIRAEVEGEDLIERGPAAVPGGAGLLRPHEDRLRGLHHARGDREEAAVDARHLFEGHVGLRIDGQGFSQSVRISKAGRYCDPAVSVDDIAAVEIYRRASSVPIQYSSSGKETDCGVLLVWTK